MSSISSILVRRMIAAAERDDADGLLAHVGLEVDDATPCLVAAELFWEVIETIVADGVDDLAVRYAATMDPDDFGSLGIAFKTAADLGAALDRLARYLLLFGDTATWELRPDAHGGGIAFVLCDRAAHRVGVRVANEAALAAALMHCRRVARAATDVTPTSVSFRHRRPPSIDAHRDFFGCSLSFGAAVDALHLDRAFLDTPTRLADEAISAYALGHLDDELQSAQAERGLVERVRNVIRNGLADGVPPMRLVARRLAMSERTLHRRLADDGLRYQDLVVEVREALANSLLTSGETSLIEIAFLTGFADQSSFQRAFKRWTGQTPLAVRRGA